MHTNVWSEILKRIEQLDDICVHRMIILGGS
jgi:hypothetical protein